MTTRILRPEEWQRLQPQGIAELLPYVEPKNIAIVVVEDGDEIVASVGVLSMTHFEGLWIKEEYRGNAGVFRPLIRQAMEIPRVRGEHWAIGGVHGETMTKLCERLGGQQLPVEMFILPIMGA